MEENENTPKKQATSKKIVAAFISMGLVIAILAAALIITNLDDIKTDTVDNESTATTALTTTSSIEQQTSSAIASTETTAVTSIPETTVSEAQTETTTPAETVGTTEVPQTSTTEAPKTEAATEAQPAASTEENKVKGYVLNYSSDNSWENSDIMMYGLQLGIENNSGSPVSGWKLELNIPGLASCDGWNGTYTASGDTLTITNAEYNGEIFSDGTLVIGCNLGVNGSLNIKSALLNGKPCTVKTGSVAENNQNPDNNNNDNQSQPAADVSELLARTEKAVQGDDWLFTDGNKIIDKDGKEVWLTGVNWFGYNTGTNTFDGLWNSQLVPTVKAIADHGFNLIRVPISAELINQWSNGEYPKANYNNAYNTELNSMNSLQIFDYFLKLAEENGIKVMPDIHCAETNAMGHNVNLWYTDKISVDEYYHALEWLAERYKDNDAIIAFDLKNEPHGKPYEGKNAAVWNDTKDKNNWKYTAETAAAKVLAKNPNVLIMVEGTEIYPKNISTNSDYSSANDSDYYFNWWGGNLRGVKDYPLNLGKYQNKLVYSPHDYGPTVYEQPWFKGGYDYDSLMSDCWKDNWFFIYEDGTAPLLIGEWGGFMREPNLKWMTCMRTLIKTYKLHHTLLVLQRQFR